MILDLFILLLYFLTEICNTVIPLVMAYFNTWQLLLSLLTIVVMVSLNIDH